MSLMSRIHLVNFLTYSNPKGSVWHPAFKNIEIAPGRHSAAINLLNGKGKTNLVTSILYLLSRDKRLKKRALQLYAPRSFGAPTHIRVELLDIEEDYLQPEMGFVDYGELDPLNVPGQTFVFGLCGYRNEEPKFYYYPGSLNDTQVVEQDDSKITYLKESHIQESVRKLPSYDWNPVNSDAWLSLVTAHVPRRVLHQQVEFHLAGGGDKSAQLHIVN